MRRWVSFWGMALLSLILFLKVDPGFLSVEKRIYTNYAISLVDDLDFNVINQIQAKETWLLSTSLNYPDMHSNGSSILWAPILFAAKVLVPSTDPANRLRLYRAAQALANVFLGLLTIPILWIILRTYFSKAICLSTLVILLACTPFYWFLLFQPENADITALFISTLLLNLYLQRAHWPPSYFAFYFGLALFVGVAVKFDIIFTGLLFLHFLIENYSLGWRHIVKVIARFATGALLVFTPIMINECIKNGFFNYAYMDTVTKQVYVLAEILFAPSGYFITHPFYAILLFLFCLLAFRKNYPLVFWFFLAIPIAKLVLEGFNYDQNETFGPRHWLDDTGCFALLLGGVLQRMESTLWKRGLYFLCALSAVTSAIAAIVYRINYDAYFFTGNWWEVLHNAHARDYHFVISLPWLLEKGQLWPLPLVLSGMAAYLTFWMIGRWSRYSTLAFFSSLAFLYSMATLANYFNNQKSVQTVSKDLLAKAVIGRGSYINSFFENAGALQRAEEYYRRRGDLGMAQDRRKLLEEYVTRSAQQIIVDPIHFKESLVPGRAKYVSERLWDDE